MVSEGMVTMVWTEASILILLSCAWEKLWKEREKREKKTWHSQSPHKQSHITPEWYSTPRLFLGPRDRSSISHGYNPQFKQQPRMEEAWFRCWLEGRFLRSCGGTKQREDVLEKINYVLQFMFMYLFFTFTTQLMFRGSEADGTPTATQS